MTTIAASALTADTLAKLVLGALAAGVGVTVAFSTLIYCADRAAELRRSTRRGSALAFRLAAAIAFAACLAIVAFGLLLAATKPK